MIVLHCAYGGVGGTGSFVSELCPRLREQHGDTGGVVFYGVEPLHLDYARRLADAGVWCSELVKRRGIDLRSRWELSHVLRAAHADVVVMHGGGTAWQWPILRAMGVRNRMVIVEHGPESEFSTATGYVRHAISISCADAVIAVSKRLAERLSSTFPVLLRGKPVHVIPNGIDTEVFTPNAEVRSSKSLLMVGTLSGSKDHATLLRSVAVLAKRCSVELRLAGDGILRAQLEHLAGELGVRKEVIFLGNIARADLLRLYREASIFTFSTKGEGSPLALLEAMSCGLPVVASDVPGVREILSGAECGLLVPPRHPTEMARGIEFIFGDTGRADRMGANARRYVETNHSVKRMVARYREVLSAL